MNVGYKYWEYYTNIMAFITQYIKNLYYKTNDELYLSTIFEKSLNIDSFLVSKINKIPLCLAKYLHPLKIQTF